MKVIARQEDDAYLVDNGDDTVFVLDVESGDKIGPLPLGPTLARGYWEPYEGEIKWPKLWLTLMRCLKSFMKHLSEKL